MEGGPAGLDCFAATAPTMEKTSAPARKKAPLSGRVAVGERLALGGQGGLVLPRGMVLSHALQSLNDVSRSGALSGISLCPAPLDGPSVDASTLRPRPVGARSASRSSAPGPAPSPGLSWFYGGAIVHGAIADCEPVHLLAAGARWREVAFSLGRCDMSGLEDAIAGGPGAPPLTWRGAVFLWEGLFLLGELEAISLRGDGCMSDLMGEFRLILLVLRRCSGYQSGTCPGAFESSSVACKGGAIFEDDFDAGWRHLSQGLVRVLLEVLRSHPALTHAFPPVLASEMYGGGLAPMVSLVQEGLPEDGHPNRRSPAFDGGRHLPQRLVRVLLEASRAVGMTASGGASRAVGTTARLEHAVVLKGDGAAGVKQQLSLLTEGNDSEGPHNTREEPPPSPSVPPKDAASGALMVDPSVGQLRRRLDDLEAKFEAITWTSWIQSVGADLPSLPPRPAGVPGPTEPDLDGFPARHPGHLLGACRVRAEDYLGVLLVPSHYGARRERLVGRVRIDYPSLYAMMPEATGVPVETVLMFGDIRIEVATKRLGIPSRRDVDEYQQARMSDLVESLANHTGPHVKGAAFAELETRVILARYQYLAAIDYYLTNVRRPAVEYGAVWRYQCLLVADQWHAHDINLVAFNRDIVQYAMSADLSTLGIRSAPPAVKAMVGTSVVAHWLATAERLHNESCAKETPRWTGGCGGSFTTGRQRARRSASPAAAFPVAVF